MLDVGEEEEKQRKKGGKGKVKLKTKKQKGQLKTEERSQKFSFFCVCYSSSFPSIYLQFFEKRSSAWALKPPKPQFKK
jgi:hypothetical protein